MCGKSIAHADVAAGEADLDERGIHAGIGGRDANVGGEGEGEAATRG
jgi:hypothetical protein